MGIYIVAGLERDTLKMIKLPEDKAELKNFLLNVHEKEFVELKKASQLPKSFWETYSSFCNTMGGFIFLGINEGKSQNEIVGVGDADRIVTDLWNLLSNNSKVSYRTINNEDVTKFDIEGKTIILIHVPEAPSNAKPVFIRGKIENSYVRTGDGDRLATLDEIRIMLRNAQPGIDSLIAPNFTIDDLDINSIISFKDRVTIRYPQMHFEKLSPEEFLFKIGAISRNRNNGEIQIKRGTLLFLGKYNSIRELYPHFHLDYFNRRGKNPRWIDRVATDEPNEQEMNILNFYQIVFSKLKILEDESFSMDTEQVRLPVTSLDISLREALVNCLAHADYNQSYPETRIEVFDGYYKFSNPGKMLISPTQFFIGGESRIRNEQIMSYFRLLGASERQGFGGPQIIQVAEANKYRVPDINTDLEHTELVIWKIDLLDSYPDMDPEQKSILRIVLKSLAPISVADIQKELGLTKYKILKDLKRLIGAGYVVQVGAGRNTRYMPHIESKEMITQLTMIVDKVKKTLQK